MSVVLSGFSHQESLKPANHPFEIFYKEPVVAFWLAHVESIGPVPLAEIASVVKPLPASSHPHPTSGPSGD